MGRSIFHPTLNQANGTVVVYTSTTVLQLPNEPSTAIVGVAFEIGNSDHDFSVKAPAEDGPATPEAAGYRGCAVSATLVGPFHTNDFGALQAILSALYRVRTVVPYGMYPGQDGWVIKIVTDQQLCATTLKLGQLKPAQDIEDVLGFRPTNADLIRVILHELKDRPKDKISVIFHNYERTKTCMTAAELVQKLSRDMTLESQKASEAAVEDDLELLSSQSAITDRAEK